MTPSPSAAQLLADLAGYGIELQPHGDVIRYRPRSAMTPALLDRLRRHKADVLRLLSAPPVYETPMKPWKKRGFVGVDGKKSALIVQGRALGGDDLADAMTEAWDERVAICMEEARVSQYVAEAWALVQLQAMIPLKSQRECLTL